MIKSEKIYNEIFKDLNNENIAEKRVELNNKISQLKLWCKTNEKNLKEQIKNSNDNLINQALDEHYKNFHEEKLKNRSFEKFEELSNIEKIELNPIFYEIP